MVVSPVVDIEVAGVTSMVEMAGRLRSFLSFCRVLLMASLQMAGRGCGLSADSVGEEGGSGLCWRNEQ